MLETTPLRPKETHPISVLSEMETRILEGLPYDELPAKIQLSQLLIAVCMKVWKAYEETQNEPLENKSPKRAKLLNVLERMDLFELENYNKDILESLRKRDEILFTEFLMKVYQVENEIVVGSLLRGTTNSVNFGSEHDGIDLEHTISMVHNHREFPVSPADLLAILRKSWFPQNILQLIIKEDEIVLLFCTADTERLDDKDAWQLQRKLVDYDDVAEAVREHKVGMYAGGRDGNLERVE